MTTTHYDWNDPEDTDGLAEKQATVDRAISFGVALLVFTLALALLHSPLAIIPGVVTYFAFARYMASTTPLDVNPETRPRPHLYVVEEDAA